LKPAELARLPEYEEDYFERHYRGYPDYGFYPLKAEKIINLAGNPKSVVDVGCAYGRVVKCLREKGVEAVGVDISRYAGQKSKQICDGWFVRAVAWALPLKDKAVTCIYCLAGDTIVGGDGKAIEDLEIGDHVLNSAGEEQAVQTKFVRNYSGELLSLKVSGLLRVKITPEHPVLVANIRRVHRRSHPKPDIYEYVPQKIQWKKASEIIHGDYLVIPLNTKKEKAFLHFRRGNTRKWQHVEIDEDVAFILGLWVAEGSAAIKRGRIVFSFGYHEKALAQKLHDKIESKFGVKACIVTPPSQRSARSVVCGNKDLATFLRKEFGSSSLNKHVPSCIKNSPTSVVRAFLKGYFLGDGSWHYDKTNNNRRMRVITSSKRLAYDVIELLLKLHVSPTCFEDRKRKVCGGFLYRGKSYFAHKKYQIEWSRLAFYKKKDKANRKACLRIKFIGNYAYAPVHSIVRQNMSNIQVYNIKTEDQTYCIPWLVHNCEGMLEHVPEELIPETFKEFERVSNIRVLAISFGEGEDKEGYHLCNHNFEWWWQHIPTNTWLFTGEGTQNPAPFKFKGEKGETKTSLGLKKDCKLQKSQYMRYYRWLKKEGGIHKPTHLETYLEPEQIRRLHWIKWHARLDTESNPTLQHFLDPGEIVKVWNRQLQPKEQNDILEVGCSNGVIIEMLNGKYGMDKEPAIIEENRKRNPKIVWILHDATKPWTMFPNNSVQVVCLLDVMEHVPFRKALFMLKEAIRVAENKILITIPNGLNPNRNQRNYACFKHCWVLDAYHLSKIQKLIKNYEHAILWDPAFICIEIKKRR
jgi:SAM-dependent methyltransferase